MKQRIATAYFACERCGAVLRILQDQKHLKEPLQCEKNDPNIYVNKAGCGKTVSSTGFKLLLNQCEYKNTQLAYIVNDSNRKGSWCSLEEDIVNNIRAGDRIRVTGIPILWQSEISAKRKGSAFYDISINVNSIEAQSLPKLTIESKISLEDIKLAIAPSIVCSDEIKESLALQLFGGVLHKGYDHYARGDIHVFLKGKPGVGKTAMLESTIALAPIGSYAPCQTVEIGDLIGSMDDKTGRQIIRAGEFALHRYGLVAIDDIEQLKSIEKLYEPLEWQKTTIKKGDLTAALDANCAVLAAGKPDGEYPEALLSRFDIIFDVSSKAERKGYSEEAIPALRNYVAYARTIEPEINYDAKVLIDKTNNPWRERNAVQRFAEAYAKSRLSKVVTEKDVKKAIDLISKSKKTN